MCVSLPIEETTLQKLSGWKLVAFPEAVIPDTRAASWGRMRNLVAWWISSICRQCHCRYGSAGQEGNQSWRFLKYILGEYIEVVDLILWGDEACALRRAGGVRWEAWLGFSLSRVLSSTPLLTNAPCWNHAGEPSATERRGLLRNLNLGK